MKIAVLGCGSIGRRHIQNLIRLNYSDIISFDPISRFRLKAKSDFGIECVNSLEKIWDSKPKVVFITSPTYLHIGLAFEVASRDCHFFVEKPLSHVLEGLDELNIEVKKRNLITMVGCNMRFHPGPMRVKALVDGNAIGKVLFARIFGGSYLPDWRPWQDYRLSYSANKLMGGGCILDGIHEIDLAYWYIGEVASITAFAGKVSNLELNDVEDIASIIFRHQDGTHSEVHLDYIQRIRIRGCVLAGSTGTITWEWSDHNVRLYRVQDAEWNIEPLPGNWNINQMYLDEITHFMGAVEKGNSTCNPIEEAVKVTRIALAAKEAASEKKIIDLRPLAINNKI